MEVSPRDAMLVMGKAKKKLDTELNYEESEILKSGIKTKKKELLLEIEKRYPDDHNASIMTDPEVTKMKNTITRGIKYKKKLKLELPNFIR